MISLSVDGGYGQKFEITLIEYDSEPLFNVSMDMGEVEFVDVFDLEEMKRVIDVAIAQCKHKDKA
jgi:hypothetical protein